MRSAAFLIAGVVAALVGSTAAAADRAAAKSDMPGGILIGAVRGDAPGRQNIIFTNVDSLPLYYLDTGTGCDAECEKAWAPFLAASDDRAAGQWTLVRRGDGRQQWAYHGNPVYTFLKDESHGEETNRQGSRRFGAAVAAGDGQDGRWHVITVAPGGKFKKPSSISLSEHAFAQGQILANTRRAPLYAFEGKKAEFEKLSEDWQPAPAGLSEIPVGEFSIVERADGIRQWAYHKQPLFSYKNDLLTTDLKGTGVVKGMKPAVAIQYFTPPEVAIIADPKGGRLIESASGKTIYARDRINWTEIRNDVRGSPEIGQSIGIAGCDTACEVEWQPLMAPASARPSGYWNLIVRPDGAKQWTYRGYALYTRANELPGVVHNNEIYDVAINHTTEELHPEFMGIGLYWRVATP